MPTVAETDTPSDLLETVRALSAESQRAVLSYGRFLRVQEDEAERDRLFNDPVKMANFAKWPDKQAKGPSEPLDFDRL